jgi:hypothetical protein
MEFLWQALLAVTLLVCATIGWWYFRDLGDVTQMVLKVKRENTLRFIRNEYRLLAIGLSSLALAVVLQLAFDLLSPTLFWTVVIVLFVLYAFPYVWVHFGLRNQLNTAQFYPIEEAKKYVNPSTSVLVTENAEVARAHPDHELLRPHLAGNNEGLGGENVAMTYCAMANLGLAYTSEIEGEKIELEVLAQHGNNLILRDQATGEPIQQIYGHRDRDGIGGPCMRQWPTFRMSFRGFQRAYPDGQVFLNKPSKNPLLWLLDQVTELLFSFGIGRQHREEKPVMDNMSHSDDRLPNKTYVWGINIGKDAVCFTDDFVFQNAGIVNTTIGGRDVVLAYDFEHESLGAWFNDSGETISKIDFFGNSDSGELERLNTLKPGMFWHVWVEFFQHTDINRMTPRNCICYRPG